MDIAVDEWRVGWIPEEPPRTDEMPEEDRRTGSMLREERLPGAICVPEPLESDGASTANDAHALQK